VAPVDGGDREPAGIGQPASPQAKPHTKRPFTIEALLQVTSWGQGPHPYSSTSSRSLGTCCWHTLLLMHSASAQSICHGPELVHHLV
jgi:hypothetical protein